MAERVAQAIAYAGHEPRRWWREFRAGDITLDRLKKIARDVDGAVLLFTSVDRVWYREKQLEAPRDNVILEYGLFVAHLGRSRTMILTDGSAKLPSDVNAITYEKIINDTETVAQRVVEHFREQFTRFPEPTLRGVPIIADPDVVNNQIRIPTPRAWGSRSLYVGVEGAQGWLATVDASTYAPDVQEARLRGLLSEALDGIEVRSLISLGPGSCETDEAIALEIQRKEPWLEYIPVDICDALLLRAVHLLTRQVRVPLGILADFEDGMSFIHQQLDDYATPPKLFSLLGNTFGNLDRRERNFLSRVGQRMRPGEYLLFDVSLAGPQWTIEHDRRGNHASFGPEYRRFIAQGIARHSGNRDPVDAIAIAFDTRVKFEEGLSDVDDAKCINIVDTPTARVVLPIRRYRWDSLLTWLAKRQEFEIRFKQESFIDDVLGDGVILLRRR